MYGWESGEGGGERSEHNLGGRDPDTLNRTTRSRRNPYRTPLDADPKALAKGG